MGSQVSKSSFRHRRGKDERPGQSSGSSSGSESQRQGGQAKQDLKATRSTSSTTWASSSALQQAPDAAPAHGLADSGQRQFGRGGGGREDAGGGDGPGDADTSNSKFIPQETRMAPATVPCQYRTGKTLGSGTYAIVKEAVHIKTGKYYACKVINKKLMEGREYMVRNEIAVLKKVSKGHRNIVTLHDYFETAHNLYLCFDLCTGGELFDRICAKGNYYEEDAAALIRTIMGAVKYIHECGIVHRDLKPENLLFRTKDEDADIMIADFGLSRVMDDEKFHLLTEICGTPGYMAPEIFKKTGHGKPVDVWAMGVITYFLLCGYTPFDRDTQQQEMEAIIAGDYRFEPEEYWANVSETARDFVRECLTIDPTSRPTAAEALKHPWLAADTPYFVPDPESASGRPTDLLPHIQKAFDAKKTFRKAVFSMIATKRMSTLAGFSPRAQALGAEVQQFKEESEKEQVDEDRNVMHYDGSPDDSKEDLKKEDDVAKAEAEGHVPLVQKLEKMSM
ncbi:Pkinase-domain-containing protein [Lentinus tigrinus ALCF2SS1-6]|uniref:Pkinase-domain-containing protein n=2 Tax=Lentinus tigrinus TaxID=5365 RepID=A0A5C2SA86_9APHY|nr:Pkinase-domain-containing protein [Lentinus tigrinus ALCF2SS1-6]